MSRIAISSGGSAPVRRGGPERGGEQGAERGHLGGELAFLEPEVEVPFAPGVVIEAGEHQPPLTAVRDQREMVAPGAQPAEHPAHAAAAPADAESPGVVEEHRQPGAVPALPKLARLDVLAGDGAPAPRGRDLVAARPRARGCVEAACLLQHEGDEGRRLTAAVQQRIGALAELSLGPSVERSRDVTRQFGEPRAVQQQPAVTQALPAGQAGATGFA